MADFKGNNHLCSFELKVWSLIQEILLRWDTFCIFRWDRMNVPKLEDGFVRIFIPGTSPHVYEIKKFIEQEKMGFESESHFSEKDGYWPGTKVKVFVMEFNGILGYLEHEKSMAIAMEAADNFLKLIKKEKEERKVKDQSALPEIPEGAKPVYSKQEQFECYTTDCVNCHKKFEMKELNMCCPFCGSGQF